MHVSNRDVAIMKTLSFIDLALPEGLRRAVADLGFEEPTPIQSLSIPVIREGRDMIGQAHTGTGKTAAYGIPLLEGIDPQRKGRPGSGALSRRGNSPSRYRRSSRSSEST